MNQKGADTDGGVTAVGQLEFFLLTTLRSCERGRIQIQKIVDISAPKLKKTHAFLLHVVLFIQSRLFWCELLRFGDVVLLLNIMELMSKWQKKKKKRKNKKLYIDFSFQKSCLSCCS